MAQWVVTFKRLEDAVRFTIIVSAESETDAVAKAWQVVIDGSEPGGYEVEVERREPLV